MDYFNFDHVDYVILGIGVFYALIAAGLFVLYRRSARLRDALKGRDGYRLMRIFARIFAVDTLVMASTAVRAVMAQSTHLDVPRQVLSMLSGLAFMAVHIWALLEVKAIINERSEDPQD